jgi:hypothetical protein
VIPQYVGNFWLAERTGIKARWVETLAHGRQILAKRITPAETNG